MLTCNIWVHKHIHTHVRIHAQPEACSKHVRVRTRQATRLRRFALRPAGGSLVIFTPSCRMDTGKAALGMDVIHSLRASRHTGR